ncbi:MAG: hypothetical protein HFI93_05865 [Lachnospiraceae bacterium]|nr:hypothetical protein [Lachnospiraceae bacterium]
MSKIKNNNSNLCNSCNRISLDMRLDRLKRGCASDPDYNIRVIRSWANTPLRIYMASLQEEFNRIGELLSLTENEKDTITYQEAAKRIDRITNQRTVYELLELLVDPFVQYYYMKIKNGGA